MLDDDRDWDTVCHAPSQDEELEDDWVISRLRALGKKQIVMAVISATFCTVAIFVLPIGANIWRAIL